MPFKLNKNYSIPVIEIEGKFLGSLEGQDFKQTLDQCKAAGDTRIVVDLSKTDFMDSSGIGVLIGGLTSMRNAGGDIKLSGMQQRIKAVFLMSKLLGSVFELYDDVEQAIESFEINPEVSH